MPMMWDIFENRLFITAELVAKTGMRVGGGGQAAKPTASDLPVMKTIDGKPFIPGSSLRGVLRSHVERIVRAFEDVGKGRGACYPLDEKTRCVRKDQIDLWGKEWFEKLRRETDAVKHLDMAQRYDLERASWIWTKTCRACQVFGSPWLASRVRVSDLPCLNGAEAETRDAVAIDRDKETVANKYDFEALLGRVCKVALTRLSERAGSRSGAGPW
jgi:CRISPR-associated protein Csm3